MVRYYVIHDERIDTMRDCTDTINSNMKWQCEKINSLSAENQLLSERVKELNNITDSFKKQLEIKSSKLVELRKAYLELKADKKSIVVIKGWCKHGKG